jgi:hypothetical protein
LHQIRPSQPVTAAKTAGDMADLPDMANSDKADANYSKTIRDKAYTHLNELVDEIPEVNKCLFFRKKQTILKSSLQTHESFQGLSL